MNKKGLQHKNRILNSSKLIRKLLQTAFLLAKLRLYSIYENEFFEEILYNSRKKNYLNPQKTFFAKKFLRHKAAHSHCITPASQRLISSGLFPRLAA